MPDIKQYLHTVDLVNNKITNLLLNPLTTAQRTTVGGTLGVSDQGYTCYDVDLDQQFFWDGTAWVTGLAVPNLQQVTTAGNITTNSIEVSFLQTNGDVNVGQNGAGGALNVNDGNLVSARVQASNITTLNRVLDLPDNDGVLALSVNGVAAAADGSITIPVGTGTVTAVTATSPITSSGGTAPNISTSMNTNKLIGRSTAGVGVMEEITVGTGLSLSGGTLSSSVTGGIPHATASGTDTYTATVTGVTSYTDGDAYIIQFTNGNTTGCTLNINGLGAIPLYRNNDGALIGGDIQASGEMLCVYDATVPAFRTIGTSPNTIIAYVTNDDSVTITKGQPVYAFSGTGDRMTVKLANNTSDATSAQTVGLVMSTSIAANQKGFIMMQGLLDGLSNVKPVNGWADGSAVYLGATAGAITPTKPYAPNHLVYLGFVTTASPGSAGRVYVRVQNGYELDELHNVQAQTPTYKDTLWYDNTVSPAQWKTASISTILGYTPVSTSRLISTTSPLSGGGDLSADRTLSISQATTSTDGYLSSTDWNTFNNKVSTSRTISTTAPLSGGGDLSANRTLSISQATTSTNGYLSSTDWNTFNNKQSAITLTTTGTSGAATFIANTLNIPQYQAALTNPVTGTGTTNYITKWSSSSALTTSVIYDTGTNVIVGNNVDAGYKFDVVGGNIRLGTTTSNTLTIGNGMLFDYSSTRSRIYTTNGINITSALTSGSKILIGTIGGNSNVTGSYEAEHALGDISQTSGTYINTIVSGRLLHSSGTSVYNFLSVSPTLQTSLGGTYTGTIRGFYYNPTTVNTFGGTNIAFENTIGDIIHGNLATGGAAQMVTADSTGKLGIQTIPSGGGTPAGSTGYVQFNTSGAFNADANLFWDNTNKRLGIGTSSPSYPFHLNSSVTASGASAIGSQFSPTLVAAANNDILSALDINPTFTNGAFTGLQNIGLRIFGPSAGSAPSLEIRQTLNTTPTWLTLRNTSNYSTVGTVAADLGISGGTNHFFTGTSQGDIAFRAYSQANTSKFFLGAGSGTTSNIVLFTSGNVGINQTTDAGYKLDVNGTARAVTSFETPQINGNTTASGSLTLSSTTNATKGKIFFGSSSAYDEVNDRLGIGYTSPSQKFMVNGNVSISGTYISSGYGIGQRMALGADNTYRTTNAGASVTPTVSIVPNGGISGSNGLMIDPLNSTGIIFTACNSGAVNQIARAGINIASLTNTAGSESGDLTFLTQSGGTAMSEKMRIFGNGNVGIGTTTDAGYKFDVNGTGRFQNTLYTSTNFVSANQIKNGTNASQSVYRTTNGGLNLTPNAFFGYAESGAVGLNSIAIDYTANNGLLFISPNGTNRIARAGINITNLTNTAGSESGDMIFLTQSGGTAMSEKMRITSVGALSFSGGGGGTATYVLTSNGPSVAPSWQPAPGAGSGLTFAQVERLIAIGI